MQGCIKRFRMLCLCAVAVVLSGASAFAQTTACDTMATTPTVANALSCVIEKVNPYGALTSILTVFVPILLVIWGLRGGMGLVKRVVGAMFGTMKRGS